LAKAKSSLAQLFSFFFCQKWMRLGLLLRFIFYCYSSMPSVSGSQRDFQPIVWPLSARVYKQYGAINLSSTGLSLFRNGPGNGLSNSSL